MGETRITEFIREREKKKKGKEKRNPFQRKRSEAKRAKRERPAARGQRDAKSIPPPLSTGWGRRGEARRGDANTLGARGHGAQTTARPSLS
jgi:predicted phage gp36 major capsid-like protein